MSRLFLLILGCVAALLVVATASGGQRGAATIEPHDRVHGMLVVEGTAGQADERLFGYVCNPVIVKSGRYRRTCLDVPRVSRLFVGYGLFASEAMIEKLWRARDWKMWIDGERASLDAFGYNDRTLYRYPPAGGKDVTLREWAVILLRPPPGPHTIRYRFDLPQGTIDATWEFRVTES